MGFFAGSTVELRRHMLAADGFEPPFCISREPIVFGPLKRPMGKGRRGKLLAEAALPLSYPECFRGSDSNRQQAIIHNFGPSIERGQEIDRGVARCAAVTLPPLNPLA